MTDVRGQSPWLPLIATALAALVFYSFAFYPGTVGFDSAYHWWQARGGETSSIHGIGMTLLWRIGDALTQGPAALFGLQLILYWCGLILIAAAMPVRAMWRIGFLLFAGLSPMPFVAFSTVISDAMLVAVLTLAVGLLIGVTGRASRWAFACALALLFLAVLLRKNALPAVVPLAAFACWRAFAALHGKPVRVLCAGLAIALGMYIANGLIERSVDKPLTVFPGTQIWDLAAMSIATNRMLLPESIRGPSLDVAKLRNGFEPYSNVSIFADPQIELMQPFFDPRDARNADIRRAWIDAIVAYPRVYLAHRWRLTRALFGSKAPEWPAGLVYLAGNSQYRDNPPVATNASRLHALAVNAIERARSTVVLAAWPYLVLIVVGIMLAWRRRASDLAHAALALLASGLFYAAPYPFVAPSAELRYLAWTCVAAVIGTALALAANPLTSAARATTLRAP